MARGKVPTGAPVAAWRAPDAQGIGHAFARRRSAAAYCGRRTWDERWDHPITSRCATCTERVAAG